MWDNASCIPPALADTTAEFPCMRMYEGRWYPECGEWSQSSPRTSRLFLRGKGSFKFVWSKKSGSDQT